MTSGAGMVGTRLCSHRVMWGRLCCGRRMGGALLTAANMVSPLFCCRDTVGGLSLGATRVARRFQHDYNFSSFAGDAEETNKHDGVDKNVLFSEDDLTLHGELASMLSGSGEPTMEGDVDHSDDDHVTNGGGGDEGGVGAIRHPGATHTPADKTKRMPIELERLERPPSRFDLLSNSIVYRWTTTAKYARRISGPMREWASELKYRTGVHLELELCDPDRLLLSHTEGGYASADDVELNVYLFGSERGVFNCHQLMESALMLEPAYVRLGVFRRVPDGRPGEVEWLLLRRLNRDLRPPDIPPISLKLPGKWTLLYEDYKEAAIRTLWEETGITVESSAVFPTARLLNASPTYYWRVPVHYFMAEVPYTTTVLGPQVALNSYLHDWDVSLLRQSPDPIDRVWAQAANPETGCAWLRTGLIDELQQPLRGADYMAIRYTPPPFTQLARVVGLEQDEQRSASLHLGEPVAFVDMTSASGAEPSAANVKEKEAVSGAGDSTQAVSEVSERTRGDE